MGVCPPWETDDVNPSNKRKSEYRKMKAAFESLDWTVPTPQKFHHFTLARQGDHLVTVREDNGVSLSLARVSDQDGIRRALEFSNGSVNFTAILRDPCDIRSEFGEDNANRGRLF